MWKWSNGVGKSEMSIIWCISITNNVKNNAKNLWNSSNGQKAVVFLTLFNVNFTKTNPPTLKQGKQCYSYIKRRLNISWFLAFQSKVNLCFLLSRKPNTRSSGGVSIWLWLLLQVSICPPLQSRQEHKFGQILILGDPKTFSWNIPRFRLHSCTTAQTLKACRRSVSAANSWVRYGGSRAGLKIRWIRVCIVVSGLDPETHPLAPANAIPESISPSTLSTATFLSTVAKFLFWPRFEEPWGRIQAAIEIFVAAWREDWV